MGATLKSLVNLAMPCLKAAERRTPRTGPGAKPQIPDWFMGLLIALAVFKRRKAKSAQYRCLAAMRREIRALTGISRFPARSTFFRRYQRAHSLFRAAIAVRGQKAIAQGIVHPRHLAVDKSIVQAIGPAWHKSDRKRGKRRRGVDADAAWGYSKYHGWTYGYSFEVVVSATPKSLVFPLLATAGTASRAEVTSFQDLVPHLPVAAETVSADAGYDSNRLAESIEWDTDGRRSGCRFPCPENPRNSNRTKTKPGGADKSREHSRELRRKRKAFLESPRGRAIYKRRSKTVEPFNSWLKALFHLDRTWHRGLGNNQTQLLAAIFCYQVLVRFNHQKGHPKGRLTPILDEL